MFQCQTKKQFASWTPQQGENPVIHNHHLAAPRPQGPEASAGAAATGATLAGGAWAGDIATAAAGACAMDGAAGVRTRLSTGAEDRCETSMAGTCTGAVQKGATDALDIRRAL